MSRVIECSMCGKHLGEIRDAKLRKNTTFYCVECDEDIDLVSPILILADMTYFLSVMIEIQEYLI